MIVDLVRHDFSRVCIPGSVKVDRLFEIQTFRTVHQMVSTVVGELQDNVSVEVVLAACFPMGSMTGAPKIRAMQLIEELETWKRGIYSGAIGFITESGDFSFNVVIRSAVIQDGTLTYGVGGAITSDSDPEAEWEETLIKARALVHAIPHLKM
jgi:para-aminobenzoate synthetase component 1